MTISYTAPDGTLTVKKVTVNSKTYDLPTWLDEKTFTDGLTSNVNTEPLSSLTSCELAGWQLVQRYTDDDDEEVYTPYFTVTFFIPFNSMREIAYGRFADPVDAENFFMPFAEITDEGAIVTYLGSEYDDDIYDITVYLLPKDLTKVSDPVNVEDKETFYTLPLLREDFKSGVEDALGEPGSIYKETAGPDGEPYFLLVQEHMD